MIIAALVAGLLSPCPPLAGHWGRHDATRRLHWKADDPLWVQPLAPGNWILRDEVTQQTAVAKQGFRNVPWTGQGELALEWRFGAAAMEVCRYPVFAMPRPRDLPAVAAAMEQAGSACAASLAALAAVTVPPELQPAVELARVRLGARQVRGECADSPVKGLPASWEALGQDALRRAQRMLQLGLPSSGAQLAMAAAYYGLKSQAYQNARRAVGIALEAAGAAESPSLAATAHRFDGLLWRAVGRLRKATHALRAVEAVWQARSNRAHLRIARHTLAGVVRDSGHFREALRLFLVAQPESGSRHLAGWLHSLGWTMVLGRAAGALPPAAALTDRLEALAEHHYRAAGAKEWIADTFAHRAWNAWLDDDLERVAAYLKRWRAALPDAGKDHNVPFALALDGQLHAAQGDCAGAWALAEQVADTDDAVVTEADWRAQQVAASALDCAGDPAAALTRRQAALDLIDAQAAHTEVTAARGAFLAAHRDLVDGALTDALRLGAVDHAFALADAVQARVVRGLRTDARLDGLPEAARAEWLARRGAFERARAAYRDALAQCDLVGHDHPDCDAPAQAAKVRAALDATYAVLDEAAPVTRTQGLTAAQVQARLAPRQALLLFARVGDRVGSFWVDRAGVAVAPTDGDAAAPWAGRLAAVDRLYVVAAGVPEAEALVTAKLGGRWLLDQVAVSYLPYAGALPTGAPSPRQAAPLVVADPSSDLPAARTEGDAVAQALPTARVVAGPAASPDAVTQALSGAPAAFHFAGHGILEPEAPWDAHLRLADGQRLTLADVLALPGQGPGLVVLSGCDTGRRLELGRYDAVGLPAAFLLRGARAVLATTRPIGDGEPLQFLKAFYAQGALTDPVGAFRRAAMARQAAGDESWQAFYLMGR